MTTKSINSKDNEKLKLVRMVRSGKNREQIFIEGRRLAEEALKSGLEISECFVDDGFAAKPSNAHLFGALVNAGVSIYKLSERIFATIADTENSQGIILIADRPTSSGENLFDVDQRDAPLIFLNEIRDPANLGAILRTAEAAGVSGVIVSKQSVDFYSPKALRASMGSAFRLRSWIDATFNDVVKIAAEREYTLTACDIKGSLDYTEIDWRQKRILVFGSEAHGLSDDLLEQIAEPIKISMTDSVESLNLAVACGIILFEAKRQNST